MRPPDAVAGHVHPRRFRVGDIGQHLLEGRGNGEEQTLEAVVSLAVRLRIIASATVIGDTRVVDLIDRKELRGIRSEMVEQPHHEHRPRRVRADDDCRSSRVASQERDRDQLGFVEPHRAAQANLADNTAVALEVDNERLLPKPQAEDPLHALVVPVVAPARTSRRRLQGGSQSIPPSGARCSLRLLVPEIGSRHRPWDKTADRQVQ